MHNIYYIIYISRIHVCIRPMLNSVRIVLQGEWQHAFMHARSGEQLLRIIMFALHCMNGYEQHGAA